MAENNVILDSPYGGLKTPGGGWVSNGRVGTLQGRTENDSLLVRFEDREDYLEVPKRWCNGEWMQSVPNHLDIRGILNRNMPCVTSGEVHALVRHSHDNDLETGFVSEVVGVYEDALLAESISRKINEYIADQHPHIDTTDIGAWSDKELIYILSENSLTPFWFTMDTVPKNAIAFGSMQENLSKYFDNEDLSQKLSA